MPSELIVGIPKEAHILNMRFPFTIEPLEASLPTSL